MLDRSLGKDSTKRTEKQKRSGRRKKRLALYSNNNPHDREINFLFDMLQNVT